MISTRGTMVNTNVAMFLLEIFNDFIHNCADQMILRKITDENNSRDLMEIRELVRAKSHTEEPYQAVIPLISISWHLLHVLAWMSAAGFSSPTNVDLYEYRHIYVDRFTHELIQNGKKSHLWQWKLIKILRMKGKIITELIQGFTERGITRCTWNRSTSIVDQNISVDSDLSNLHCNNGVNKVLDILLSDFVSPLFVMSLWTRRQAVIVSTMSAQCQCRCWKHSPCISGKCCDIGVAFTEITTRYCGNYSTSGLSRTCQLGFYQNYSRSCCWTFDDFTLGQNGKIKHEWYNYWFDVELPNRNTLHIFELTCWLLRHVASI